MSFSRRFLHFLGVVFLALVAAPVSRAWSQTSPAANPLRQAELQSGDAAPTAEADANPPAAAAARAEAPATDAGDADEELAEVSLLDPLKKEFLTARLQRLSGLGLEEDVREAAEANYNQALKSRSQWKGFRVQISTWKKEIEARPEQIAALRDQSQGPPKLPPLPDGLSELEAKVTELEQEVQSLRASRDEKDSEIARRAGRKDAIPREIAEAQAELRTVEEAINKIAPSPPSEDEVVAASELIALVNKRQMLQAKIEALQLEQVYAGDTELIRLQLDQVKRDLAAKEERLEEARRKRNQLQQAEADRQAEEAARAAAVARPPAVAEIADRNAKLAAERQELTARLTDLNEQLAAREAQQAELDQQYKSTTKRVEELGLTVSAGKLLLRQRKGLPHPGELRRSAAARLAQDDRDQFRQYELQDEWERLGNLDQQVTAVLAKSNGQRVNEAEVRQLLQDQRNYLEKLVDDYTTYSNKANQLAAAEEALAALAEDYDEYIAERVLWIRSSPALGVNDVKPAASAAKWSLDLRHWRDSGLAIWQSLQLRPVKSAVGLLIVIGLLAMQTRARRRLREIGATAEKRTCAEFAPTARALGYTVLVALPWPALIWFISWSLDHPEVQSDFVHSLSGSTLSVAYCLFVLEVIRALCRADGLADAHFDWPQSCLAQIRRHVRWLTMVGLPLVLWFRGLELQETEPLYGSSLGRVCFIALMLLLVYRLYRMLMSRSSPFRSILQTDGWWEPVEHLWRPATALLPLGLAVLAAVGYYFSAQQAAVRLLQSLVLLVVVLVTGGMTRRWLLTNRRSLAREQAKQRRAQLAAAAAAAASAGEDGDEGNPAAAVTPAAELAEETVDLAALSEQTQKLVRTSLTLLAIGGLYLIWNELLPAVAYLSEEPIIPGFQLKWSQALAFMIVLAVTYVAVRDIPALLELVLLQRLPLDSGSRYAIATIARYILAAIGIGVAYSSLGYTGENIQWLVAAMGVGLGFGLQEIFANFVSGIILLFERPIRVGDIVTLGDKTGAVTRIRMRATTIVDWDRKEYIVPNKDLVTERLLNWTLTDATNRIVVNVGVAYGSDTDLACELLLEAAREIPAIVDEPQSLATFEGFGDSSLNLVLRTYLPSLENRLATIHALHTVIDRKFREAGIEIPFPQRDLNLRKVPADWLASATSSSDEAASSNGRASNGHAAGDDAKNHVEKTMKDS